MKKHRGDYKMQAYIDGVRDKAAEKLSPSMQRMLHDTGKHGDPFWSRSGRSEVGAAGGTMYALRRAGLMSGFELTDAGRRMLAVEWRYPEETTASAIEIQLTDRIGEITAGQIDHLARGLEHAHEMTLKDAGGGRYWLESLDGGALLVRSDRTVDYVWKCAEAISSEAAKQTPKLTVDQRAGG